MGRLVVNIVGMVCNGGRVVGMVVVWNGGQYSGHGSLIVGMVWIGGQYCGIVGMVVVWNGGLQSPAGAFSAGRPSADAGLRLSANNGRQSFLKRSSK